MQTHRMYTPGVILPLSLFADPSVGGLSFEAQLREGLVSTCFLAFASGLALTLTPCVYPLMALTVGVFGAGKHAPSQKRAAALSAMFVLGLVSLLTTLGVSFALSGKLFGSMLAQRWVSVGIAGFFGVLAASMFGAFDLTLPSGVRQRLAKFGGLGLRGAFGLGLASALLAAPCTGPFLTGLLVWLATTRNVLVGACVMLAFAFGLGTPFFLVGTFALRLPKGGRWMVGVKRLFAVMLGVAGLHFFTVAFPSWTEHLPTKLYAQGLYLALGGLLAGGIHLVRERSDTWHSTTGVLFVCTVFGLFLWLQEQKRPDTILPWYGSEQEALAEASAHKKPLLLDFTASWCGACAELDRHTFADRTFQREAERFVLLRIDATHEDSPETQRLTRTYRVVGLPTILLLDSSGKEQRRFSSFVPPRDLVEALRHIQ